MHKYRTRAHSNNETICLLFVASSFRNEVRVEHAIQKGRHWNACQKNSKKFEPQAPSQAFWTTRLVDLGGGNPSFSQFWCFFRGGNPSISRFWRYKRQNREKLRLPPPKKRQKLKNSGFRPSKQHAKGPQNAKPEPWENKNTSN